MNAIGIITAIILISLAIFTKEFMFAFLLFALFFIIGTIDFYKVWEKNEE